MIKNIIFFSLLNLSSLFADSKIKGKYAYVVKNQEFTPHCVIVNVNVYDASATMCSANFVKTKDHSKFVFITAGHCFKDSAQKSFLSCGTSKDMDFTFRLNEDQLRLRFPEKSFLMPIKTGSLGVIINKIYDMDLATIKINKKELKISYKKLYNYLKIFIKNLDYNLVLPNKKDLNLFNDKLNSKAKENRECFVSGFSNSSIITGISSLGTDILIRPVLGRADFFLSEAFFASSIEMGFMEETFILGVPDLEKGLPKDTLKIEHNIYLEPGDSGGSLVCKREDGTNVLMGILIGHKDSSVKAFRGLTIFEQITSSLIN